MSKIITAKEVAEIVNKAITEPRDVPWQRGIHNVCDAHEAFLTGLGDLIATSFGGEYLTLSGSMGGDGLGHCLHFQWNKAVPVDGGIYADYDIDVSLDEWMAGFDKC